MSNKLKSKYRKKPADMTPMEVAKRTGAKLETIKEFLVARQDEMAEEFEKDFNDKLTKSQDYIAANHLLVSFLAIRKAYGYKKAFGKYLDIINECQDELNRRGVKDVYQEMKRVTGREICFDSEELNNEFGFGN